MGAFSFAQDLGVEVDALSADLAALKASVRVRAARRTNVLPLPLPSGIPPCLACLTTLPHLHPVPATHFARRPPATCFFVRSGTGIE